MSKHPKYKVDESLAIENGAALERDATLAAAQYPSVALALFDMDGLLEANRAYGIEEGDRLLIEMCTHIKTRLKEGICMYRVSGDQFGLLFPGAEKEDAFIFMEDARRALNLTAKDGKKITFTAGISASPEDGTRYQELYRRADGAMYRGKLAGRDRVCLAKEEKMITKTSHYTVEQLQKLTRLSSALGIGEAILLREALDDVIKKYDT